MKYILEVVARATGEPCREAGVFIKSFDPDAHAGHGHVEFTRRESEAMVFDDVTAALKFRNQTSRVKPLRSDGKPNRPLTAYTLLFMPIDEVKPREK
jgi:hypothetical protein